MADDVVTLDDLIGNPVTARDVLTTALVQPEVLTVLLDAMDAQESPVDAAVPLETGFLEAVDKYLRKKIGPLPWVHHTRLGTVLSVQTRTCTVSVASVETPVTGVLFGPNRPTVGDRYPVRFPVALPPEGTLLAKGPVPFGPPWIKVPGGARWLYAQAGAKLYRWSWPPPTDVGAEWPAEDVATVDRTWTLIGGSTPPGEATQIVLEARTVAGAEGDPQVQAFSGTMHHLDAMGFGDEVHTYTLTPNNASSSTPSGPGAIANDGIAVAAVNIRGQAFAIPDAHVVLRIRYVPDGPQQSCCIDFGVFLSCIFIDNFKPVFDYADVPQPPVHREMGQGLWLGAGVPLEGPTYLGQLQRVGSLTEAGGIWDEHQHTNASKKTCTGSGCHVITGFLITWDTYNCEYSLVNSDDIVFWFFEYLSALHYEYGAYGAWEYDGQPAAAWAWLELATPPLHMRSRFDMFALANTRSLKVQGYGCTPAGPSTLAIGPANVLAMSLDPTTRELIVWYRTLVLHQDSGPDITFHRWRAGADAIFTASQFYAASRDGTDALIEQAPGLWAYTLDGGETWVPCRSPDPGNALHTSLYKLVDELG